MMPKSLICPVMSHTEPRDYCIEGDCALWDVGNLGVFPGCGLVPRESRKC